MTTEIPLKLNNQDLFRSQCCIGGTWVGEGSIAVCNPATQDMLAKVPNFGEEETNRAIAAASKALPGWKGLLAKERGRILRRWFDLIMDNQEDLATIMTCEQGKPLAEAKGEIAYAASFVEFYSEEAKRLNGEILPSFQKDSQVLVTREPIGVVACITPWNFPAAMITRKMSPALAAGCTGVIKPAEDTPLTALALMQLAQMAGLPDGVLNMVTGDSSTIGKALCSHEDVRLVGFTGSTKVGQIIMKQASEGVKKVALELGGNAPFIVFDDADLKAAVEGLIACKFRNAGQTCVCANRIYVQDSIHDEFVSQLKKAMGSLKVGKGLDEGVTIGPLINQKGLDKVEAHIRDAMNKGADLLLGGSRHELGGTFFQPTLLTGMKDDMQVSCEETFGPVAGIYRFATEEEAIRRSNATRAGLASYFYARDMGRIQRVMKSLAYGMVGVNTGLISSELVPFGGVKESGIGREGGHYGLEEFTEIKYSLISY
jgi:succinate-semialdehyde dehydrogenase/glutarate-semialdehyde dehydrogenase